MKIKKLMGCMGILATAAFVFGCSSDDSNDNIIGGETTPTAYVWGTDGGLKSCNHILFANGKESSNGTEIGNGDQEFVFTGKETLKKGTYLLKGWVYIANGAELTIEPGTVIKGDKGTKGTLIVERGGKLFAQGTASAPIVFTSAQAKGNRRPGDWGGVILCGKAANNQGEMQIEGGPRTKHGGNSNDDNSGTLSYVRIEFAGYPYQKDKEINGLTLGSVGSGTKLDHIQVSYSNDDSYEWFGGTVNAKYLIAYKGWDDDFDTDNGYSGKVQFGLAVRDSKIADTSQSNSFESDNSADGANISPLTSAVFSNITLVGPKLDASFENTTDYITGGGMNPGNGAALGKFQAAFHIRRNSRLSCFNSVAIGYPIGLILDNQRGDTQSAAANGIMKFKNILFAGMDATGTDANKSYDDVLVNDYDANSQPIYDRSKKSFSSTFFLAQNSNKVFNAITDLLLTSSYMPTAASPVFTSADFTDSALVTWFTHVPYVGALNVNDAWMEGWTNFSPETTDY